MNQAFGIKISPIYEKQDLYLRPVAALGERKIDIVQDEEIKNIAFEIATQGTQGYRPDKDDYRINSIKGKTFSGYHILAYYYVSWSIAIPEMVSQLNLPYEAEYKMAKSMFNKSDK